MEEKEIYAEFTLENILRKTFSMTFSPVGMRRFMGKLNKQLNLGPIQSSVNLGIATSFDVLKYSLFAAAVYQSIYTLIKTF